MQRITYYIISVIFSQYGKINSQDKLINCYLNQHRLMLL